MESSPELGTTDEAIAAVLRLQPADADDRVKRGLFFCHSVNSFCRKQLEAVLNNCRSGQFGESIRERTESSISEWNFSKGLKILTCINLNLTGIDHGGVGGPDWIVDFLSDSMEESDRLFPEPAAAEIIQAYGSLKQEKMQHDVGEAICLALGFTKFDSELIEVFDQFLTVVRPYRSELLVFALSQPEDVLLRHLQQTE